MNTPSIGMACNIYNDALALPGLLETASQFFDELFFIHAGPNGKRSTDGTIELIEKWGAKIVFDEINSGFGDIRTKLIHQSKTDWVMILDADERFYHTMPVLICEGEDSYPNVQNPVLKVTRHEGSHYNQGRALREIISKPQDAVAIRTVRRHWFDFSLQRPTQNWFINRDWQLRLVKNEPFIRYKSDIKMHEQIIDDRTGTTPKFVEVQNEHLLGPFHDHFHCFFKPLEPEQRAEDISIYNALHEGTTIP